MTSSSQVIEGVRESTGIDLTALLSGYIGGKVSGNAPADPSPEA